MPCALFDLDGTIINSGPGIIASMHAGLGHLNMTATDESIRELIGLPLSDMFLALGVQPEQISSGVAAYRDFYGKGAIFDAVVFDGVPAALRQLAETGWVLGVATSKLESNAVRLIEYFQLSDYFEGVFGADLEGRLRNKTDVIQYAMQSVDAAPKKTLMIGDRSEDLIGATTNGLAGIGVTWGFGSRAELESCNPLAVVDTPVQLSDTLKNWS